MESLGDSDEGSIWHRLRFPRAEQVNRPGLSASSTDGNVREEPYRWRCKPMISRFLASAVNEEEFIVVP
jgi:hypothetical protein